MEIVSLGSPGLLLLGAKRLARITEQLVLQHLGHLLFVKGSNAADHFRSAANRNKIERN
jgi:alkylated DNA repair dioxygenase AlkB